MATRIEAGRLSAPLNHAVGQWLDAPSGVLHFWSPHAAVLRAGVKAFGAALERLSADHKLRVFRDGDFLPLLHQINLLVQAHARGGPGVKEQARQVWLLESAQRMLPDQFDILQRTCLHCPGLHLRVALFSQVAQAPAAAQGVRVHEIQLETENAVQTEKAVTSSRGTPQGWLVWVLGGATVLLSALMVWQATRVAMGKQAEKAVPVVPAPVASVPVSPMPAAAVPEVPAAVASAPVAEVPPPPPVESRPQASDKVERAIAESRPGPVSPNKRWLTGLPPDSLLVVHARLSSQREAEGFRANKEVLANARVLKAVAEDGRDERWLVVSGPFRSSERAQNYMQRLEWKERAASVSRETLLQQAR